MDIQSKIAAVSSDGYRAELKCYHCGMPCREDLVRVDEKSFCCSGCKLVYELIAENNLCDFYALEAHPGLKVGNTTRTDYEHLELPNVRRNLLEFDSSEFARVTFSVPAIHCSSCIWLLENLQRADQGVLRSEVNFTRKEISIEFHPNRTGLSKLAGLLDSLGYPPKVIDGRKTNPAGDPSLVIRLAVAGFVFGNVMLFSFPEYLGLNAEEDTLSQVFSWLNLVLSLPVVVYSASGYWSSALKSFRQRQINIDVPIALGLLALFCRSAFDIITHTGPGYLDSLTGLVFFLLIGRWIQGRTYESLSFERDFKSFFPMAVQKIVGTKGTRSTLINELRKGDRIRIRNLEIVPADSILEDKAVFIDYSFVTGESKPMKATEGELVYAGGRLLGQPAKFIVEKETSQSRLTSLWNRDDFRKRYESNYRKIIDRSARVFTWIVLAIAAVTTVYWYVVSPSDMWLVLTSVLMVACPCALALAAPFTYGTMMRAFGRNGFYLKNADVIERIGQVDTIVFDKTGTITHGQVPEVTFEGNLSHSELAAIKQLTSFSTHPLSNYITGFVKENLVQTVDQFEEKSGKGIEGIVSARKYKIGSAAYIGLDCADHAEGSSVFVSIDDVLRGRFIIRTSIRQGMKSMLSRLNMRIVAMLSGDSTADETLMRHLFPIKATMNFNQQPVDKMLFIRELQRAGRSVLMVGDGLNDAGGLKQADVGVAVTDDTSLFTPGCDGIMQGDRLKDLDKFHSLARSSALILKAAFMISFLYNSIALTIAVTGNLTPIVAAILMPVSSISVVGFSTIAVNYSARRKFRNHNCQPC